MSYFSTATGKTDRQKYLDAVRAELEEIKAAHPAQHFIPNIGQERFLNHYKSPKAQTGRYPFMGTVSGGNGGGKTVCLVALLVGCAFGREELSDYFQDFEFFDDLHRKWKERGAAKPLHLRIICESSDMEETGELFKTIQAWFPRGRYQCSKSKGKYYSTIICDNGVLIDVRTHNQAVVAQASSNIDGIFVNEPYPEHLHGEIVGRTRNGGFIVYSMTPDKAFAWMTEQIYDAEDGVRIVVEYISTWDNCKDIPGTRGHLSRHDIENMIEEWKKLGPEVVEARLSGRPMFGGGVIYSTFSAIPGIHIVPQNFIQPENPIYCVIDPHDSKPPFIVWIEQGQHESRVIREWPTEDYFRMGPTKFTIAQVVQAIREIERGFASGQVAWRFMDPNKGATTYANTGRTVQGEYLEAGLEFHLAVTDNIEIGHNRVLGMLYYNASQPAVFPNIPELRVEAQCKNVITAFQKYALKRNGFIGSSLSARLEQKYKDPMDPIRYYAVSKQPWLKISELKGQVDEIFSGRVQK